MNMALLAFPEGIILQVMRGIRKKEGGNGVQASDF